MSLTQKTKIWHNNVVSRRFGKYSFQLIFLSLMHWFEKHEFSKKNHWAPFKVVEVKKSFLRSLRPNFGFHLLFMGFDLKISVVLGFDDLGNLRRPRVENFNSWHFLTFSTNWHFSHKGLMGLKKISLCRVLMIP